ncbi:MAG TPA: hypothetical protein VHQ24_01550 [Lachnospiraceae bacterium]|nr:hypothetical protein [Lachnospiraceae bacterium]
MLQDQYPHFEKDSVLKAEMLVNLMAYPRDMFSLMYQDYSDGIVTGVHILVEDTLSEVGGYLVVKTGIVKYQGRLYHMQQECRIPYEATEKKVMLKIKFLEVNTTNDFTEYHTRIVLDEDMELQVDEMELCRFLLKEGARLRQDYQDVKDFDTEHNTVNRIHVPYSGIGEATIAPEITTYFGRELMKYQSTNPYDIGFSMLCMQQNQIQRTVILQYLNARINVRADSKLSNEQIHTYLVMIMDEVKAGRTARTGSERMGRRVIVE